MYLLFMTKDVLSEDSETETMYVCIHEHIEISYAFRVFFKPLNQ